MSTLVANIPPTKVWVRREHLRDLRDGHGEYTLGYWVSAKSIPGRAIYFETYLPEYGAMFDKLTIGAFLSWDPDSPNKPEEPSPDLPLEDLQFWNSFDHGLIVV
jgi:hypothetical protein